MAQKNKALIVLGSLVVIGSVGYYLLSKSKKGSKGEGSIEPTPNDSLTPSPTPTPKNKPTPIVGKTYNVKDYLNTSKTIMDFQDCFQILIARTPSSLHLLYQHCYHSNVP
jgi:hypothetical protein